MPIVIDVPTTPETGVDLCAVWFNNAEDPADMYGFRKVGDTFSVTSSARLEVRQLANRRRLIRKGDQVALNDRIDVTLHQCTRAEVAWVRAHTGILLCVRDHVGSKFFGVYADVPRDMDTMVRDRIDVRLALESVTHTEAV